MRRQRDCLPWNSGSSPRHSKPEVIEPVSAILIGAGVVAGANFVLDWWDRRKGGLVINLRPDAER